MKILDKIWNILGLVEAEEQEATPTNPVDRSVSRLERKIDRPVRGVEETKPRRLPPDLSSPVTGMDGAVLRNPILPVADAPDKTAALSSSGKGVLVISHPMGFDDARQIAENLTNGRTVVVNFERTDEETTKRTVDFMSGITYAVGGSVQRITGSVFLFAPASVDVTYNDRLTDDGPGALPWNRS